MKAVCPQHHVSVLKVIVVLEIEVILLIHVLNPRFVLAHESILQLLD